MCVRKISSEKKRADLFSSLEKIRSNGIGSIFCKVKRSDGIGAWGFCLTKNEHPKGFGALEDCPN
jgi:hypothetical protein